MTKQDTGNQKINNQEKSNKNNQGRRIWEGLSISGKQWVIAVIIFASLGTAGLLVMKQIKSTWTSNESKKAEEKVLHKGQIESIGDKVDSEAAWRYQQNEKIKKLQDGIHGIKQELTKAKTENPNP